ncbi:MAG: glycosyltransferase family 4 protein [Verrucomicrobiota bacterium]
MRIAYLHEPFITSGGGAPLSLKRLAEEMVKRGHEVTIFAGAPMKHQKPFDNHPGNCTVQELRSTRLRQQWARKVVDLQFKRGGYRLNQWLDAGGYFYLSANGTYAPEITKSALYKSFDVIVLFASSTTPWTIAFSRVLPKLGHKATFAVPYFHPKEHPGRLPIHTKLHEGLTGIITATDFESKHLREQGWEQKIIQDVGVGSDTFDESVSGDAFRTKHRIPPDVPLILFLGRKVYNKGVIHVVEAMDRVWDAHPDARLALIGFAHNPKSWLKNDLKKSRHEALSKTIDLYDVPILEREEALAACTVMAAPSISDSFGIVYLDAWRNRKPVMACKDTCCESFIEDGRNGHLVTFGDTREISDLLLWHIQQAEASKKMGERGYELWDRYFRWEHVAERSEAIYMKGLSEG